MGEPKNPAYWQDRGYRFFELSNCQACGAPVEFWEKGNQLIPLDKDTMETHWSQCPNAQSFRNEQKLKAGVL